MPSQPFIGQLMPVGFNFAPLGWALCDGQLLPIDQNTALYSLIGTTFGGDGQITFALPNLQDRIPIHAGQGLGLTNRVQGESAGVDSVTLTTSTIPAHNHGVAVSTLDASSLTPSFNYPATPDRELYAPNANATGTITTNSVGGSQPHDNDQPFLCINWVIALEGIFPSRN